MILYVVRYWPTLTETFVRDEIAAQVADGVEVRVVAGGPRGDPHVAPDPAPVALRPHRWGWLRALPSVLREWLRRPALVRPRVLWLAAEARRARHVHVHFAGEAAAWAAEACARAGVPWSVTVHAVDLYRPRPDLAALLSRASFVATVSEANRVALTTMGIPATVVRCGVPDDLVDPAAGGLPPLGSSPRTLAPRAPGAPSPSASESPSRKSASRATPVARLGGFLGPGSSSQTLAPRAPGAPSPSASGSPSRKSASRATPVDVLAVGRWVPKKGLGTLLAAAELLPEARVCVVSDLPDALPRPANVVTPGLLPRADVLDAMRGARVFCLPCRVAPDGDRDGVPVVILEAMALGLPVVTTAVSGLPELVDAEIGWIVPPDDPAALAEALRAALADPEEARRRGAAGCARIRARGLTVTAQARAIRALWEGAGGRALPPGPLAPSGSADHGAGA